MKKNQSIALKDKNPIVNWIFFSSQFISRNDVFHRQFYLPEVNIQVQKGHRVLSNLVPRIRDIELACWVLHAHVGPEYVLQLKEFHVH